MLFCSVAAATSSKASSILEEADQTLHSSNDTHTHTATYKSRMIGRADGAVTCATVQRLPQSRAHLHRSRHRRAQTAAPQADQAEGRRARTSPYQYPHQLPEWKDQQTFVLRQPPRSYQLQNKQGTGVGNIQIVDAGRAAVEMRILVKAQRTVLPTRKSDCRWSTYMKARA